MGARRSREERAAQRKVFLLMFYLYRQHFTDAKYWHKADPTGAYRNFGGEVAGGSLRLTVTCPKSQSLDSAQPGLVSVSRTQLGPATLCGPR